MYQFTQTKKAFLLNMRTTHFSFIIFLYLAINISFSHAQVDWQRHENPVLQPGETGEWDAFGTAQGTVLFFNGSYHMWYNGWGAGSDDIGHATSQDGLVWEKDSLNPVLERGPVGTFDHYGVWLPYVININDTLHLFYTGHANPEDNKGFSEGHAFSIDGHTWTKDTLNPVLSVGANGTWDDSWLIGGSVLARGGVFHIWYAAWDGTFGDKIVRIGHAKSKSLYGREWIKDPTNPALEPSGRRSGSWEDRRVEAPMVYYDGTVFHMWYIGGNLDDGRQIGYAWSENGVIWKKYPGNPVLTYGAPGSWDEGQTGHNWVILEDRVFKMWYTGLDKNDIFGIGYATSTINMKADFKYKIKNDTTVSFTDYSIVSVTDWSWDFGDGKTSDEENPQHVYEEEGTYNVTLTASGPYGSDTRIDTVKIIITALEEKNNSVAEYTLKQNYPNPFNPATVINYELPITNYVNLTIYNITGQKVATLVDKKQAAGAYEVQWDASGFASGVYLYKMQAGDFIQTRKMLLVR